MAERPLFTLYKNLKAQNFDVPDDYDKFESALTRDGKTGADNRHAIYQSLKQQNFDVPDTYERFYSALFVPHTKDSSRAKGGDVPMTAADRARFSAGARSISQSAGQTMRNAGRYNTLKQRRDRRKNDFGRVNIGTHKTPYGDADNIVKDDFAYNPETGKAGTYVTSDNEDAYTLPVAQQKQGALDEQNNAYQEAVDTGEIPSVFDVRDKNGNYDLQENIGKDGTYLTEEGADAQLQRKLDEAYARKKQLEDAIAEDNAKNGNPLLSYGASIGAGNGRDAASSDYRNKLATSLALVNEQIGSLEAVKQYPNSSVWQDAWKALDNTAFNAKTWDFGLTDFAVMGQMERIKTKIDNKLPLTSTEQTLLKSKLGADAAAALEDEKMGKAYRWTKIAGQSLPFMADFFMTGGYGGITRVVSKGALKYAAKKGMSKLGAAILKNTGVVAGDVIGSYAMAASTQALKTGADIMQRHLGTLYQDEGGSYKFGTFDDNGNLLHEGGETMGKALYKGLTSAMVENYTEKLFGHNYGIKKGALNFMEKHGMTRSAEFFKNLGTKDWYAGTKKWMAKFGINGFGEEVMEEEIGIPLHAILDGDNKISDLADLRQQMDIIGGMAISVGSMYALGAGMRPVKGVYNRAQYYRFKNKVNNADAAASSAFGNTEDAQQKWADLKNKIDNTPNEKMGGVMVDIIRSTDSMSKAQIDAAVHYGVNLMKMRGYNLASTMQMDAKAMTGEQNTPEDQHQEEIDNAYSEGHEAEGSATHDIQQEYQLRLRNIAKMLGISEEQVRNLDDTALDGMTGKSDAKDMAIYQWQAAKARYQGVMDNVRDKVDTAAQEAATRADMITDKSRGTVRNAMMKGNNSEEDYPVYILGGNVSTHDDGAIDVSGSDKMIFYYDPSTGKVESCDPTRFASIGEEVNASDAKAMAVQMAREKAIREQTRDVDGRVEVGSQFTVMDQDGTQHDYEVLADNGDGTVTISIDGNVQQGNYPSLVDLQQLRDQSDGLRLTAKEAENVQNQVEGQAKAQVDQMPFDQMIDDEGKITPAIIAGEEDKMNFVTGRIGDSRLRITTLSQNEDGSYKVTNRVKKADAVQFGESMSVDDYKRMVGNEVQQEQSQNLDNGSSKLEADRGNTTEDETRARETETPAEDEATTTAETSAEKQDEKPAEAETAPAITLSDGTEVKMKEDGNPDMSQLTPAQVAELYDTTFEDDADQIISDRVSSTKKALDKAENMKVTGKNFAEQKANADAKKKAIAEAQAEYDAAKAVKDAYDERMWIKEADTPEGRRDLIDKAKAKYQRLKGKAENVTALWNDTIGKVLHRLYDGLGVNVFDHEPQTIEEYVSSNIAPYSLNYEGNENSKGVKQETGLERKDFAKSRVLAAEGKGQTVDEFVHKLWDNRPKQFENVSDQEIRNALLDLIMSDMNAYDMSHLIENNRIAQAEREIEDEKNEAENARLSNEADEKSNDLSNESSEVPTEEQTSEASDEEGVEDTTGEDETTQPAESANQDLPFGEQIDESDVPFSARNDAQGQAQSERAESIEKNRVKDMQVVDDVVGKKTRRAFERIAKMMGATINWQYTDKMGNGWYDETTDAEGNVHRTIYITLDSSITDGAQFIFGHEMTHEMKSVNPASYEEFKNIIKNAYAKDFDKAVDQMEKRYSEAGFTGRDRSYYEEEVIADGIGELMRDLNLAHGIAMKMSHPLLARIHDILLKIARAFTGTEFRPTVEQVIRSIEQAYVKTAKGEFTPSTNEGLRLSAREQENEKLNDTYNEDLQKQIDGKLPKGFIYEMGLPSPYLQSTGIPMLPIKLSASVLNRKSNDENHPYKLDEIKDLVKHIQKPLAIFAYGDKNKAQNLMIAVSQQNNEGKQFLVGISISPNVKGEHLEINSVRNVFPKNYHDWVHWILQGKALRIDGKKEIQAILDALRINPVDYINENDLDSAAKIVNDFQNPSLPSEDLNEINENVQYSLRTKPEPKKKGIGYKVFLLGKDGKLYPPMVANPNGNATPVGVWLDADAAPIAGESKTGRPQVKQGGKGTQGGSGTLAYRPGWHLGEIPYALQFNKGEKVPNPLGIKNKKGEVIKVGKYFPKNFVFAEVEYADDVDYQDEANKEGYNENGKFVHSLAGLKHLPTDGSYKYRTNANPATDSWVITGAMKVNRILTRAEQADLVKKAGREPQQIQEGDIVSDEIVNRINQEIANAPKFSLKVYHGSQASFDHFDHSFMGSGEGNQAYGWGTYVSEVQGIAKAYAKQNAKAHSDDYAEAVRAYNASKKTYEDIQDSYRLQVEHLNELEQSIPRDIENSTKELEKAVNAGNTSKAEQIKSDIDWFKELLNDARKNVKFYEEVSLPNFKEAFETAKKEMEELKPERNLYTVEIPDDTGKNYLDWDGKLPKSYINRVNKALETNGKNTIQQLYPSRTDGKLRGEDLYDRLRSELGSQKAASMLLKDAGFDGVKVIAQRNSGGNKDGKMNYVIFDENDAKITSHTKFSLKNNDVAKEFHSIIDQMFDDANFDKSQHLRERYDLGNTPDWMKEIGIKGDDFSLSFKSIKLHKGKDSDHDLTRDEWHELPNALMKPFAITKYQGEDDRFRLYVNINHDGKPVAVGVDVKRVNQGKNKPQLDVNSIKTVFAHQGSIGGSEVLVTYDKEITPQQQALLRGLNFHEYPTIQELSAAKIDNSSETTKENGENFSLRLKNAIAEADTNPSDAQKESGNYKKGHVKFGGYDFTIENPKGSTRSGKDADGKEWKVTMHDTYGYIRGKFGKDGDHLDMFINDDADLDNWHGNVYVVDQKNADGSFDEHKVMYGFDSEEDAKKAYLSNYSKGWKGLGSITGVSKEDFDKWVDSSKRKMKPFADHSITQNAVKAPETFEEFLVHPALKFSIRNEAERKAAENAYNFAMENRPDESKQYAIVDMSHEGRMPEYFEKKALAKSWSEYYNKVVTNDWGREVAEPYGNYKLFDLDKPFQDQVNKVEGKVPDKYEAVGKRNPNADNESGATYRNRYEQGEPSSVTYKDRYEAFKKAVAEPSARFSLKDDKTLAGVHNITEDKLRRALKLGGLANPSVAVIDTDKASHNNFGEISLIAPSALVDKRTGKTAGTWTTDAYTQRYPLVERQMTDKGYEKFKKWVDGLEYSSADKSEILRQTKAVLEDNGVPAWELMYLKEKGIDLKAYDSDVDYRWQEIIENHPTAKEILDAMKSDPELSDKVTKLAKSAIVMPTWSDISKQVRKQIYEDTGAKVAPINPKVRAQVKEIFERDYAPQLLNKDGSPRKADVKKVVEDMVKQYDDTKKYSFYKSKVKASSYVNSNGLYPDYIRWQENKLDEFGTKNRIFRGYKNDGTRKYVPETLENVSKAMREDANGQTNGGEYTSFGSFIAKLADRVDSTEEMRANKDKLASNEDKEAFYNKWEEVYYDLAKSLYNDLMYGEQRLHDIVVQPDPKKYAKKEYGITLTASFVKKLNALKDAVQNELKSGYFETKFDRPVRLNEFVAAVVPNNLGDDVRKGLEKAGLSLYEYNPNEESGRQRAFDEAANSSDEIKFSLKQERESIVEDAKKNGTYMLAPNGKKTKLDAEQWANVRTDNFKKWFGDWENDPENASKVVDENGEPMVVYHGRSTDFNTFEKKEGVRFVMGFEDKVKADGFFFSPDKGFAEEFAGNAARHRGGKANVVPCFLNIRKPLDLVSEDYDKRYEDVTGWSWVVGMDSQDNLWEIMDEEGMADKMKAKGYDGAIFVEEVDDNYEPTQISYCALDANQIKSADNNNGDYSADNNDIRFSLKAMDDNPEGWKQANKKAIHIAEAIERDPKFSLKELEGTLIKAGTYFSGGGLVEEGLKGIIDPVVAVEYDEKISGVYRNNFGLHLVTADVRDVDPKELVKNIDGEVEYFHASPVCKNFSQAKANHEEVELDKETAKSTADFINEVKPKVVTIENVKGYRDSEAMKTITDALDKNGYKWDADVYNAADYGGYTNRERLIVRAVKDGELPEKPKKMDRKKGWYEAVEDIMPTLTEKKNGVAPWMDTRLKADGIDWKHIDKPLYVMGSAYADGKVPHAFGDELLPTLRTKSGDVIVMPDGKVYRSSGRVLARVSGVSDDYKMPYSEALSHTIIGNGIPTQLTEHVIAPLLTSRDPKFSLRGYHGTGAKFDRFDLSHALEGEGSESFGHGVYVTSSAEIGKAYAERAKLDKISKWINNDNNIPAKYRDMDIKPDYRRIARGVYEGEPLEKMKAEAIRENEMEVDNIKSIIQRWERGEEDPFYTENYLLSHHLPSTKENREKYRQEVIDGYKEDLAIYDKVIKTIRGMKEEDFADVPRSYRYDVEIPDDNGENYLSWKGEIPSSLDREELADRVFVDAMLGDTYKGVSKDYKEKVREDIKAKINKCKTGKDLHEVLSFYGDKETVSEELSDFGFVGIKYPAGTIHGGAKEGDTNYVIFDEDNAKIVGNTKFSLRRSDYEKALSKWKKENNLPKDAKRPVMPQQKQGESQFDYMLRVNKYLVENALWKTAPRYEGHLMTGPSAQAQFNRELQRRSVLTRIAVQDAMLAIRKAQEAIAKEAGIDHIGIGEDAYTAENRSHGKAKNEFEEYNQVFLEPLRKSYHKLMLALDHSYDNVKVYMIAKHGLERNRVMAFRDALANDYEENAAALTQYYNYMVDVDKLQNDVDFETGKIDYVTWWQNDDSIRVKYAPSYLDKRYNQQTGRPNDYAGLSSLFDGDDYEAKAYNMVHDVETAFPAETAELWKNTNLATKRVLRNSLDAGMMTKETFDYVNSMFQNYIPLRGWNDTTADDVWDYVGGGKGAFNEALKSAKGRTSLADDPIAYIENMAESGILINNRNWVKQHLLLLAENHPENTLLTLSKAWYVKTKDSEGNDVWMPSSPNIPASMTDPAKIKVAIKKWLDTMERLRTNGEAKQQREGLNIVYPQTNYEERQHEVRVMRNGEEYVIYVNGDPQLAQAINNSRARRVRETQNSWYNKVAASTGRAMAALYTSMSPLFVPANYFRDLTMTTASTAIREDARYNALLRKNLLTTWDTFKLVREYQNGSLREKVANGSANADEKMFYDYMMQGGETGFVSTMDIEDFKKKIHRELKDLDRSKVSPIRAYHAIMEGIEYLNRVAEGSNRFLIYKTSIQYGRSVEEAINNAKDVTLNFNRKGTGEKGWQFMRDMYLFVNPAIQSLQTLGALAKHHPIKFTAVTTAWMLSGMLVPMVNQMLLAALGGDDDKDKYWSFSRYDRRNNFVVWVPGTKMFLKVPLSQEFRPFYGVGDMIASKLLGNENVEESWKDYAEDLMGSIISMSPVDPTEYGENYLVSLTPNFIRPFYELAFNVDFTGKPLFKDSEFNKYDPNWTKAYAGTPDWLVRTSRMVNSIQNDYPDEQQNFIDRFGDARYNLNNPAVVDHLLSSYLGGAYTLGSQIIGAATKALNDPKDFKTADVPFFSKFVSNPDDRPLSKKKGEEFWHVKDEQDRVANTIRNLKKNATASGDFSQMEKFFGTDEYKEYKANLPKMKKYDEERKLEKLKETGDEDTYKPHKITADDIYNAHATASDDFEDLKMKLLWKKAKALMDKRDVLGEFSSQGDEFYNEHKAMIDAAKNVDWLRGRISENKKMFLSPDGKDAFDAKLMKEIRGWRKEVIKQLESADKAERKEAEDQ